MTLAKQIEPERCQMPLYHFKLHGLFNSLNSKSTFNAEIAMPRARHARLGGVSSLDMVQGQNEGFGSFERRQVETLELTCCGVSLIW